MLKVDLSAARYFWISFVVEMRCQDLCHVPESISGELQGSFGEEGGSNSTQHATSMPGITCALELLLPAILFSMLSVSQIECP